MLAVDTLPRLAVDSTVSSCDSPPSTPSSPNKQSRKPAPIGVTFGQFGAHDGQENAGGPAAAPASTNAEQTGEAPVPPASPAGAAPSSPARSASGSSYARLKFSPKPFLPKRPSFERRPIKLRELRRSAALLPPAYVTYHITTFSAPW